MWSCGARLRSPHGMPVTVRLISYGICPFVQRAIIALREKDVDHMVEYVDLGNKPAWFSDLSPRGKVPILVANDTPLFESHAICEYIDEAFVGPSLMPDTPHARAVDRAWFTVATEELLGPQYSYMLTSRESERYRHGRRMGAALQRLEIVMSDRTWLSGDGSRFGMADVGMLPFFHRARVLENAELWTMPKGLVAVSEWMDQLLARPSLRGSVPKNFVEEYLRHTKRLRTPTGVTSLRA